MKYNSAYTSLQCWHIRKIFPPDVAEQIIRGERDLSADEITLRDEALHNASKEESD